MIDIRPDPAHPRGGYAELSLLGANVAGETIEVAVFDNYSERWLGEAGWQPVKVLFGPYPVVRENNIARVVIGPEIVNQIDEYATVRIHVGQQHHDISWPEDVVPAPGAAKIGGIVPSVAPKMSGAGGLSAKMPEAEPDPEPVAQDGPDETADLGVNGDTVLQAPAISLETAEPDATKPSGRKALWLVLVLLALAMIGAGYYYMYMQPEPEPVAVVEPEPVPEPEPEPTPEPEPVATDTCSLQALRGLSGFAAQSNALRICGADASADTALSLLEQAAGTGDAAALFMFGVVYDSAVTDADIETGIGLTFADNPATAADYYARALEAGSLDAQENLTILCERLVSMTDTLAIGAYADHCGS